MRLGLKLTTLHESCNRLAWLDGEYDVITVSQALHWLDDVLVCRGICRLLRPGGSFFVIHAAFDVPASHPLDFLLGRHSVLGDKVDQPFTDEVQALVRRLSLLFEALDAPDVDRANLGRQAVRGGDTAAPRIALDSISLFRQERPMGMGFARAFLTSRHIEVSGRKPGEFWLDLEARCTAATPAQLAGTFNWALLHFRRGTNHPAAPPVGSVPVTEIGYEGPSETRGSLPRFFRKHSAG